MKLSIIVPVYNVEDYIERCIKSLLCQDIDDYEIIVVNDGTPDKSIEVINEKFNDPKIRIVNRENGGLSAARNTGIDNAKGEYVWFVDSDDFIEENCLLYIISCIEGKDILVLTNGILEKNNKRSTTYLGTYNMKAQNTHDLLYNYIACAPYFIYKKSLLVDNNLRFKLGVLHEDMEFTPRVLFKANSFSFFEKPLYHQTVREGSITHTFNVKRATDVLENAKSLFNFYLDNKNEPEVDKVLIGACKCIIYGVIYSIHMNNVERLAYIKGIREDRVLNSVLKLSPLKKYNHQRLIIKFSPSLYLKLFDFLYSKKYGVRVNK